MSPHGGDLPPRGDLPDEDAKRDTVYALAYNVTTPNGSAHDNVFLHSLLVACSPAYRDGKRARREAIRTLEIRLSLGQQEAEQLATDSQVHASQSIG
jgi:hypothetical protein